MFLSILCLVAFTLTVSKCEPPVNTYLPPSSGFEGRPSAQYGTPGQSQGLFGGSNPSGQGFGNLPRGGYNPPGITSSPSTEYGVPSQSSFGPQRAGSRGPLGRGQESVPDSQYGGPNQQGSGNGGFGATRGRGVSQRPDSSYGTPNELQSSGRPGFNSQTGFSRPPSSTYGTPDFGNNNLNIGENYRESGVDSSNKPAKYEFSYEVDNPETGTKFGHSEQRDGDVATGEYNVLLPDGRKQVVEYEADQEGFKPQIRYEGAARGGESGFGRGGGPQGYPGASAGADANSFSGSGAAFPQFGGEENGPQSGRYQQPDSGSSGYSSGRPVTQGFGRGGQGYPGDQRAGGQGSSYPGSQANRGQNGRIDNGEGYPRGSPNGPRGSGY